MGDARSKRRRRLLLWRAVVSIRSHKPNGMFRCFSFLRGTTALLPDIFQCWSFVCFLHTVIILFSDKDTNWTRGRVCGGGGDWWLWGLCTQIICNLQEGSAISPCCTGHNQQRQCRDDRITALDGWMAVRSKNYPRGSPTKLLTTITGTFGYSVFLQVGPNPLNSRNFTERPWSGVQRSLFASASSLVQSFARCTVRGG